MFAIIFRCRYIVSSLLLCCCCRFWLMLQAGRSSPFWTWLPGCPTRHDLASSLTCRWTPPANTSTPSPLHVSVNWVKPNAYIDAHYKSCVCWVGVRHTLLESYCLTLTLLFTLSKKSNDRCKTDMNNLFWSLKVKGAYSSSWEPVSELRGVSCHITYLLTYVESQCYLPPDTGEHVAS